MSSTPVPSRVTTATVIGNGAMGTLCALLLAREGTHVALWGRSEKRVRQIEADRENKRYLAGFQLPDHIRLVSDTGAAFRDSQLIVSAVPCQHIRSIWKPMTGLIPHNVPIVSVAKGIEIGTLLSPTEIIHDCIGPVPLACLSGPCIAPEAAAGKPTTLLAASQTASVASLVQTSFNVSHLRVYTSLDVIGVELAGAVKNVIALAAGICDGIDAGNNAKASLLTRGLVELTRLGVSMGASPDTFRGLAGVGDLVTTFASRMSRNRCAGERIGLGATTEEAIAATDSVIEGIPTTKSVLELAERHHVEMPIVSGVASVLFDGVSPADAIEKLMSRPLGSE